MKTLNDFKKEYSDLYQDLTNLGLTDADVTKAYENVYTRVNPGGTRQEAREKFLDQDSATDILDVFGARNEMRRLTDLYKNAGSQEEREELAKELSFQYNKANALMEGWNENPIAFIAENLALGFEPFVKGAVPGAIAGTAVPGVGTAAGALVGGIAATPYEAYNIWQAENLARAIEEGAPVTRETFEEASRGAIGQATLETLGNLIPGGAVGSKILSGIAKTVALGAVAGGVTEAGSQAIQRASIDELELLGEGGLGEIVGAGLIGAAFGGALGGVTGLAFRDAGSSAKAAETTAKKPDPRKNFEFELDKNQRDYTVEALRREEPLTVEQLRDGAIETDLATIEKYKSDQKFIEDIVNYQEPRKNYELYLKQELLEKQARTPEQRLVYRRLADEDLEKLNVKSYDYTFGDPKKKTTKKNVKTEQPITIAQNISREGSRRMAKSLDDYITIGADRLPTDITDAVIAREFVNNAPPRVLSNLKKTTQIDPDVKSKFIDMLEGKKSPTSERGLVSMAKSLAQGELTPSAIKTMVNPEKFSGKNRSKYEKAAKALNMRKPEQQGDVSLGSNVLNRIRGIDPAELREAGVPVGVIKDAQNIQKSFENVRKTFADQAPIGDLRNSFIANQKVQSPDGNFRDIGFDVVEEFPLSPSEQSEIILSHMENLPVPDVTKFKDLAKTEIKEIGAAQKLLGDYLQFLRSPQDIARRDPDVASLLVMFGNKLGWRDAFTRQYKVEAVDVQNKLGAKLNETHELLAKARLNKAKYDKNTNSYINDQNFKIEDPVAVENMRTLDNFYKSPVRKLIQVINERIQMSKADGAEVPPQFVNEIGRLEKLLSEPYVPFRRFGDMFFKYGESVYSLEGKTALSAATAHRLSDGTWIDKSDWKDLRARIKSEYGEDLGATPPTQLFNDGGDVPEGQFFRPNTNIVSESKMLDQVAGDAALMNVIASRSPELKQFVMDFKKEKDLDVLGRTFRRAENVLGFSQDWERVFNSQLTRMPEALTNIVFQEAMYDASQKVGNSQYAKKLFDYQFNQGDGEAFLRSSQAVLAFGGNISTALLGLTNFLAATPSLAAVYDSNYAAFTTRLGLTQGKLAQLVNFSTETDNFTNKAKLMKLVKDEEIVNGILQSQHFLGNTLSQDIFIDQLATNKKGARWLAKMKALSFQPMLEFEKLSRVATFVQVAKDMKNNPERLQRMKNNLRNDAYFNDLLNNSIRPEWQIAAEYIINGSHGIYGNIGRAQFQRGTTGALFAPFVTYTLQTFESFMRVATAQQGWKPALGAYTMIATMGMLFGLKGTPLYQFFDPIYEMWKKYVEKIDTLGLEKDMEDYFDEMGIDAQTIRDLMNGAVGKAGVDISERVGIGNPYGFATDFITQGGDARNLGFIPSKADQLIEGKTPLYQALLPAAATNVIKAADAKLGDGHKTQRGEVLIPKDDITTSEAVLKSLGLAPTRWNETSKIKYFMQNADGRIVTKHRKAAIRDAVKIIRNGGNAQDITPILQKLAETYKRAGQEFTQRQAQQFYNDVMKAVQNKEYGILEPSTRISRRNQVKYRERLNEIIDD